MYVPELFAEQREGEIDRILRDFPLAVLIATGSGGLTANHIPLLRDGVDRLIGHVALANDLHREIEEGSEVLAVFRASDAYVSPNWYPTKREHHRHVPTWNYQAVHCRGRIHFSHDRKTKTAVVGKLTKHFEQRISGEDAWKMSDAPRDFMAGMLDSIVAFHIEVSQWLAKSKLSQNREAVDAAGAADGLEARGESELAEAMKEVRSERPGD